MDLSSFPPFYTLQPNYQLQQQYINAWIEKITQNALKTKNFELSADNQIFTNSQINRKAEPELINKIINSMLDFGLLEQNQGKYHVKLQSVTRVAQLLLQAFKDNMLDGDVYTFDEILEISSQVPQLNICSREDLVSALKALQQQKQVVLIGDEDNLGVKIDLIK